MAARRDPPAPRGKGRPPPATKPHATKPHATKPHATKPHATAPHATKPHVTSAKPHATSVKPHATRPHATKAHASAPASAKPRAQPHPRSSSSAAPESGPRNLWESPQAKQRRAFSSVLPPTSQSGSDTKLADALFDALERVVNDDADTLTHGFHSYPARMHPSIAATVLNALAPAPSSRWHVVDPFCGSGTVLIEARLRGFESTGVDINPIALRVARVKTDVRDAASRARFSATLDDVVEKSKERVRDRAPGHAPLNKEQVARYEGHVLRELAGLFEEIEAVTVEQDRKALEVVLSAIIIKVSKQRADTDSRDEEGGGRRMGRFIPTEIFHKKGKELVERWSTFADECPRGSPSPKLFLEDARRLREVLDAPADVVITSPPYAGTYDYANHHSLRVPWLGVSDADAAMLQEIGARRNLKGPRARDRWDDEVRATLASIERCLAKTASATAVLVVGDGEVERERVAADEHIAALAPSVGLVVVAVASAPRLDWRGGADRHEHLVAVRRADPRRS